MSKMVSARIPDALFEQGSMQLKALGATTSELVNAAFEYLLREGALPTRAPQKDSRRSLSRDEGEALARALRACSLDLDISSDIASDKAIIQSERTRRYEALA